MIKIGLMILGAIALITTALIGFEPAYGYFKTSREMIKKNIEKNIPFKVEVARLEGMVDELNQVMRKHQRLTLEREVDLELLNEEITRRNSSLKGQKENLVKAQKLLTTGKSSFEIGQKKYTREQVERDTSRRIERYESDQKMIVIRQQTASTLTTALNDAKNQLEAMKDKRQEYVEMLQVLRANHLQLEAKKQLAATVQGLALPNVESEFGQVEGLFNRLNKRLKVESELLDKLPVPTSFEVDYGGSQETGDDVLKRLNETLSSLDSLREQSDSRVVEYNVPGEQESAKFSDLD